MKPYQLASLCLDGQHFAAGVHGILLQLLHKGDDPGEHQPSVPVPCGAAYLLNLAEKNVLLKAGKDKK